jgi:hypothetical protein
VAKRAACLRLSASPLPVGNTLPILQELGFIYLIDDLSRDEPSIRQVNGRPFAVIPIRIATMNRPL